MLPATWWCGSGHNFRTLWSECLHAVSLHQCLPRCRLDTLSARFRESSAKLQGMFKQPSCTDPIFPDINTTPLDGRSSERR
jgi:hypothetical protein